MKTGETVTVHWLLIVTVASLVLSFLVVITVAAVVDGVNGGDVNEGLFLTVDDSSGSILPSLFLSNDDD